MRKFLSFIFMSACISVYAANLPGSLSIQGTALNEGTSLDMKQINNGYELFTSLKAGDYSFSEGTVPGGSISGDGDAPYYIRIDFDGVSPVTTVKKIEKVYLWAPWHSYTIGVLQYNGNSTFKGERFLAETNMWGDNNDNRYKILMDLEGGELLTYQPAQDRPDSNPDDNTLQSYYNMYLGPNGQWPGGAIEYKIADKYNRTGKYFNVEVVVKANEDYTHIITDYIANLTICDDLYISGTAMESGMAAFKQKEPGVFECVTGLKGGNYKLSGTKDGQSYYFSTQDDKLVENDAEMTISGDLKPYYIKVDLLGQSLTVLPINSIILYYSSSGYAAENAIPLTYANNGKFTATATVTAPPASWNPQETDIRYKFKMNLDGDVSVFWGSKNLDNQQPEEVSGDYYNLYTVNDNDYDYAFKIKDDINGTLCNVEVIFATNGNYTHTITNKSTSVEVESASGLETRIYPTAIDNQLIISTKEDGFAVELISVSGSVMLSSETSSNQLIINNINLPRGIYIVKVVQNGAAISKRIIKK